MATGSNPLYRIDTHHHIVPPKYFAAEREKILGMALGRNQGVIDWTPARALDAMDSGGVATAVTSISAPGAWFGNVESARRIVRDLPIDGLSFGIVVVPGRSR